jgi:hypothetical protein
VYIPSVNPSFHFWSNTSVLAASLLKRGRELGIFEMEGINDEIWVDGGKNSVMDFKILKLLFFNYYKFFIGIHSLYKGDS